MAMHGPHHAHARECRQIGVDAAAGRDEVVGFRRREAAERNVVGVVLGKRLPHIAGAVVVQLDRPGGAADRVGKFGAAAHFVDA